MSGKKTNVIPDSYNLYLSTKQRDICYEIPLSYILICFNIIYLYIPEFILTLFKVDCETRSSDLH